MHQTYSPELGENKQIEKVHGSKNEQNKTDFRAEGFDDFLSVGRAPAPCFNMSVT